MPRVSETNQAPPRAIFMEHSGSYSQKISAYAKGIGLPGPGETLRLHFTNYCSTPVLVQKMLTWFSFRHNVWCSIHLCKEGSRQKPGGRPTFLAEKDKKI